MKILFYLIIPTICCFQLIAIIKLDQDWSLERERKTFMYNQVWKENQQFRQAYINKYRNRLKEINVSKEKLNEKTFGN